MALICGRERSKVSMAILKPVPSWPTSALLGTWTLSSTSSAVSELRWPILPFIFVRVSPSASPSTTKQEMPLCRMLLSRVANTIIQSATVPLVMKCLVPFRT